MARSLTLIAMTTFALGLGAFVHAQTTQPSNAERLAATTKQFGATTQELDRFVRRELGDPIVVDGDLIVGVHRDANGHVTSVLIHDGARDLEFGRSPDSKNLGLRYMRADLTDTPNMASADDIDGDGRVDRIMLTPPGQKLPNILLRIGTDFVQAKAAGNGKMQAAEGKTLSFDASRHEWVGSN